MAVHQIVDLDIEKLSQYITSMRHFADKAENLIQKALLEKEVKRMEEKDEKTN